MGIISALLLIACGVLAASALIVKEKPQAGELIEKMVPYQGIGGVILLIWGLIHLIHVLVHSGVLLRWVPVHFVCLLLIALVSIGLGFLLGYGLIRQYVLGKNESVRVKGEQIRRKLTAIQVPLGLAGIVLGLWGLISSIVYL